MKQACRIFYLLEALSVLDALAAEGGAASGNDSAA
jgi:hypothetical protein